MGPMQNATRDARSTPKKQGKIMTLPQNAELLDMYHRLRSAAVVAHHFKIMNLALRTIANKENLLSLHCNYTSRHKNCVLFTNYLFILY